MESLSDFLIAIWHLLGSPSVISGLLIAAISTLTKYTRSKLKKLDEVEKKMDLLKEQTDSEITLLKEQVESLDRLFTTRINDLKE